MGVVFAFALLLAVRVSADPYYVARDGKPENDGSKEKPWPSVEYALSKVGGGHTIVVRPGVYPGPIEIPKSYAGTEAHPTVIRSEEKWKAVIVGAPVHGISNGDDCHWVVIDGFEVMGARYDGIKMNGDHDTVRNCWVHNNAQMGVAMHNKKHGVIENNLIEFNGTHIQFHHGVYADGDGLILRNNIIRHNAGFGLHLYPEIKNAVITNNLVYGQANHAGVILSCPEGGGKNLLINNTIAQNRVGLVVWNGKGETIRNNILAENAETEEFDSKTHDLLMDYNLCETKSEMQGPHGLSGDPKFVDSKRGVFWLRADSPAMGRGTEQSAPTTDFWGRPLPQNQPRDIGAFRYVPSLTTEQARASWYYQWPYGYPPNSKYALPDLWRPPE